MKELAKIVSLVIVITVVMGSLAALVSISPPVTMNASNNADTRSTVYITSPFVINQNTIDPLTGEKGKYGFDSDVVVTSTGALIVQNATVYFLSDVAHKYSLTVNGSLILDNATLTVGTSIKPVYTLNVTINGVNATAPVKIINSKLLYPGWFNVTGKTQNIVIRNSVFDKLPSTTSYTVAPPDYGPSPNFHNSVIRIYNTSFNNLYTTPSAPITNVTNIGYGVDPNVYNSSSAVLISSFSKVPTVPIWGNSPIHNFTLSFDYTKSTTPPYDGSSWINITYLGKQLLSFQIPAGGPTSGSYVVPSTVNLLDYDLTPDMFLKYVNEQKIKIVLTQSTTGYVLVSNVRLYAFVSGSIIEHSFAKYNFYLNNSIIYGKDVFIAADYGDDFGVTHNAIVLMNDSYMYVANLTVNDTNPSDMINTCFFVGDDKSEAYIFRYSVVNLSFQQKVPIPGLYVNATPYITDTTLKNKVVAINVNYSTATGVNKLNGNVPYAITDKYGKATLALLSDIVNLSEWPNSQFVGVYTVNVYNTTKTFYTTQVGLDYYPWLRVENNTHITNVVLQKYKDIDIYPSLKLVTQPPYLVNNPVTVNVTVFNSGADTAYNITLNVSVNGVVYDTIFIPVLNGHSNVSYIVNISGTEFSANGIYNISASVSQIWDYNAANNVNYVNIKIGTMNVVWSSVPQLVRYQNAVISVIVNSYYTETGVNLSLYAVSGAQRYYIDSQIQTLINGTNLVTFNWNNISVPAGSYILELYANATLIGSTSVTVYLNMDLGVVINVVTQGPYLPGKDITINVVVRNTGIEAATGANLEITINSNTYLYIALPTINGGGTYSQNYVINGSYFATNGVYQITAKIYDTLDYNTNNNTYTTSVKVGDLYATSWSTTQLINHHSGVIYVDVYSYYALSNVNMILYLNGTQIVSQTVDLVSGTNTIKFVWQYIALPIVTPTTYPITLYANATQIGSYSVYIYKDVDLSISDFNVIPSTIYVGETVNFNITVVNTGTQWSGPDSNYLVVTVYSPFGSVVSQTNISFFISGGYTKYFTTSFVPQIDGIYKVQIEVYCDVDYNTTNNVEIYSLTVKPAPFVVSSSSSESEFVNGTDVVITATVKSTVDAQINVGLNIPLLSITDLQPVNQTMPVSISAGETKTFTFVIPQNVYVSLLRNTVSINVPYYVQLTSNVTGDATYIFGPKYFVLKEKPDFEICPGTLKILFNGDDVSGKHVAEGVKITIQFQVENIGGVAGNMSYNLTDNGKGIEYMANAGALSPGEKRTYMYNYTINGIGNHTIGVTVNPNRTVSERYYGNNEATVRLQVIAPDMLVQWSVTSKEHNDKIYVGDHVIVVVKVINKNATESQGRTVYVEGANVVVDFGALGRKSGTTNMFGVVTMEFVANKAGKYAPTITVTYGGVEKTVPSVQTYTVESQPIPWYIWAIIAVAAAVGGFFAYEFITFRKEAPEYMICGSCGRLVPADAEKCPYCGTVFEKEKVQCPDCGSWIDEDSKFCPICGTVFMNEDDPEYEKHTTLKERYDQYLEKYREEAKKYIGEEHTNEEFFKWWKTHPEFISFLEWMKRQEEEISGETVNCPVCGALNPKGSKICRVCGSPLPEEEEEEKEEKAEGEKPEEGEEKPSGEEEMSIAKLKEEYEKIKAPGIVSFEEWVKRKRETAAKEVEEGKKIEEKPAEEEKAVEVKETPEKPKEEEEKEKQIKCPVCGAYNKPDAEVCSVCGAPLKEKKEKEEGKKIRKRPPKPVVKKKVIKKVVAVKKEEEENKTP